MEEDPDTIHEIIMHKDTTGKKPKYYYRCNSELIESRLTKEYAREKSKSLFLGDKSFQLFYEVLKSIENIFPGQLETIISLTNLVSDNNPNFKTGITPEFINSFIEFKNTKKTR